MARKWSKRPVPAEVRSAMGFLQAPIDYWVSDDGLQALLTRDDVGRDLMVGPDERWHISLQGPGRVPSWDELASCAHVVRPGVTFVIGVPPRSWWLNLHENVLHLWELRDGPLEDLWRAERQGHTPTKGGG